MFKQVFLPLIAVAVFITLVGLLSQGKLQFLFPSPTPASNQKVIKINDIEINIEVAKTDDERLEGLSNRNSLAENSGMIFVFPKNSNPTFWMKDTKIALDLVWINDDKVTQITKNVQPELGKKDSELKKYTSSSPIDYVLEVNGGFCDKNGIKAGASAQKLSDL